MERFTSSLTKFHTTELITLWHNSLNAIKKNSVFNLKREGHPINIIEPANYSIASMVRSK